MSIDIRTVLIIDDYADIMRANMIQVTLAASYDIGQALTLADARKYLSHHSPDVILLKTTMPDGSGIDFCGEIRGLTEAPILLRSFRKTGEEEKRAFAAGGNDYFSNSASAEEVALRVAAAMRRRHTGI